MGSTPERFRYPSSYTVRQWRVFDAVPTVPDISPEILLFEPTRDGGIRLTGADFIVFKDEWEAKHPGKVPELNGQLFHLFDSPNRFGLDPFYTLHVWAWKDNPNGTFANWNPDVSCDAFNPKSETPLSERPH
jgi:hypothetical protein